MNVSIIATAVVLICLLLILTSLGFGLFYLLTNKKGTNQTVTALSWRVGLSMFLFIGLLLAVYEGWILPNPGPF